MDTLLRQIPKVDDLLRLPALKMLAAEVETSAVTETVRRTLDRLRADILVALPATIFPTTAVTTHLAATSQRG